MFYYAVCKCSRRTFEEEKEFGSYCGECWEVLKNAQNCLLCSTKITKERLYVTIDKKVLCKRCFIKGGW